MTAVRSVLFRHVIVVLVVLLAVPVLTAEPAAAVDDRKPHVIRDRLEYLVNRARARRGLRRLRVNRKTQYWAKNHARHMARRRTLYHDSNLGNEIPRGCEAWGENIGRTSADKAARRAMTMFMNSSSHRSIILAKRWTHMGFGVVKRGGSTWIVQRFIDR